MSSNNVKISGSQVLFVLDNLQGSGIQEVSSCNGLVTGLHVASLIGFIWWDVFADRLSEVNIIVEPWIWINCSRRWNIDQSKINLIRQRIVIIVLVGDCRTYLVAEQSIVNEVSSEIYLIHVGILYWCKVLYHTFEGSCGDLIVAQKWVIVVYRLVIGLVLR